MSAGNRYEIQELSAPTKDAWPETSSPMGPGDECAPRSLTNALVSVSWAQVPDKDVRHQKSAALPDRVV
jgi:hypothetical protein